MKTKLLEILTRPGVLIILTSSAVVGFINGIIVAINHLHCLK